MGSSFVIVATLVLAMIGYVTWQSIEVARREMLVFTSLANRAMQDEQFDRTMRYALQAYPYRTASMVHAVFLHGGRG